MSSDIETLLATHKQQKAELDVKNAARKKSATKKTRKGVQDLCESLDRQLHDKQAAELAALTGGASDPDPPASDPPAVDDPAVDLASATLSALRLAAPTHAEPSPATSTPPAPASRPRKPNRAKARLARRADAQAAAASDAADEAAALPDLRQQEAAAISAAVAAHRRVEHAVRSDGHCLYAAFADQLRELERGLEVAGTVGVGSGNAERTSGEEGKNGGDRKEEGKTVEGYRLVRRVAAEWMERNRELVEPFLEESFEPYVAKVRDTAEWGGQVELLALASAYDVGVSVVQDGGRVERIGDVKQDDEDGGVWLAYYRHQFGLGEHYDSLRKKA